MTSAAPKFKWTCFQLDGRYELREIGQSTTFATVFSLNSDLHRTARKAGFQYSVYIHGLNGPIASCRTLEAAKALGAELAAPAMAELNSVAWAAGRDARKAARAQAEEAQSRAAGEAKAKAFARKTVLRAALDCYINKLFTDQVSDEERTAARAQAEELRAELDAELAALAG